jgi:Putative MetA-pathway of phenol degradation
MRNSRVQKEILLRYLSVICLLFGVTLPGAFAQATSSFCSNHSDTLYCLTPNAYANPNPDPFTAVLSTLGAQLGMVPLASPASGIIYVMDPGLKIPVAAGRETFGPVLVERGETLGRRKLFLASTYQHFSFSTIDGIDLKNIPIVFKLCDPGNGQCAPIATNNSIQPTIDQFAVFGTYGFSDRIDFSFAIPIIKSSLAIAGISCTQPYCQTPIFSNQDQISFAPNSFQKSSTGIGDVGLRAKGQIWRGERFRLAAGVDFRVPSGDALNFHGTGAVGVKPFIALSRSGYFAPHVNIAYQWNGTSIIGSATPGVSGKLPNNFFYDIGADARIMKRITIAGDVLGEYITNALRLQLTTVTPPPTTTVPVPVAISTVGISNGSFPTLQGSIGAKVNPFGRVLVSGNVLFSMTQNGLRNRPVPLVGVSYTF